ncbi:YjjW family glycine radical enzyme activase [Shewanella sp. GXUN23E]|uniref:YjjW family glycine radical enzyme activase n=1 Tax=Shewanella sp. GXUN23E TaxID=3422498 RepID=UPI003D7D5C9E
MTAAVAVTATEKHSERSAKVSRILTFSCVDGPGNRLVIFLQGCNFNCKNCHNPHTINHCNHCGDCVAPCPAGALSLQAGKVVWDSARCTGCDLCLDVCPHQANPKIDQMSVSDMLALIRRHHLFLSGITVSGGEATLQLPFIIALFRAIKADSELKHLTCFIDSNGELPLSGWDKVAPWLDGAMIDLKAWQAATHHWLVGRDNHKVLASIRHLASLGKLHEVRLLHIPGKSDLEVEVAAVGEFLASLPESVGIRLNAFGHHGVVGEALEWSKCTRADMERFHSLLYQYVRRPMVLPAVYV